MFEVLKRSIFLILISALMILFVGCNKNDEAWKTFDNLLENAELLKNIAVVPEYEILNNSIEGINFKNNFQGLDFELKAMATDGKDGYLFAFDVTANDFEFKNYNNYYFVPRLQGNVADQYTHTTGFNENGKALILVVSPYSPYLISTEELENAFANLGEFIIEITEIWAYDEDGERVRIGGDARGFGGGITFRVKADFPLDSKFIFEQDGLKIIEQF